MKPTHYTDTIVLEKLPGGGYNVHVTDDFMIPNVDDLQVRYSDPVATGHAHPWRDSLVEINLLIRGTNLSIKRLDTTGREEPNG